MQYKKGQYRICSLAVILSHCSRLLTNNFSLKQGKITCITK